MSLLFVVRKIKSPYRQQFRGYRMTLVVPNQSGMFGGPAYTKKFIVYEGSDLTEYPTKEAQDKFAKEYSRGENVIRGEDK